MQRVTVTLDDDLIGELDTFEAERGNANRSEALRDLARAGLQQFKQEGGAGACVAALVYTYDHEVRALASRLASTQHDHHDLSVATLHVHLDHQSCLEVAVLRGATGDVRHFSRLLVELGMEPEAAIQAVRHARKGAIETPAQLALVRRTVSRP